MATSPVNIPCSNPPVAAESFSSTARRKYSVWLSCIPVIGPLIAIKERSNIRFEAGIEKQMIQAGRWLEAGNKPTAVGDPLRKRVSHLIKTYADYRGAETVSWIAVSILGIGLGMGNVLGPWSSAWIGAFGLGVMFGHSYEARILEKMRTDILEGWSEPDAFTL